MPSCVSGAIGLKARASTEGPGVRGLCTDPPCRTLARDNLYFRGRGVRAVVQRVSRAEVRVETESLAAIGPGLLVLLAVGKDDSEADAEYLARKIIQLRIFEDAAGKMNLSVRDLEGEILLVSQFTLYGDCRKGNRPSFFEAAPPALAQELIKKTTEKIRKEGVRVSCGRFQTRMQVHLVNEGPVTLFLDSRKET